MSLNLVEFLARSAGTWPDKPAIVFNDFRLSYRDLAGMARRFAGVLSRQGVEPGDRVALLLPNTPHFPIIFYGVLWHGAVAVPMNVLMHAREVAYQLADSGAVTLVAHEVMLDVAREALRVADRPIRLIVVEKDPLSSLSLPDGDSFNTLMASSPPADRLPRPTNPEDTAEIVYTAAMSGWPMGAELTHANLFLNTSICGRLQGYQPEDRCFSALPFFHTFGQTGMMHAPLMFGSTIFLFYKFEPAVALECFVREGITIAGFVPTMCHYMVHARLQQEYDLSSLRAPVVGGAKMPLELADQFRKRFNRPLMEGYGLTETSPVVSYNIDDPENRLGSVGRPVPYCYARIVDNAGNTLKAGETGEVQVRGHNVMKGYWNRPRETAETIRDGWLATGDLGYLDQEGFLWLTGVKKPLIIRAGLNIYPPEVERLLLEHPRVQEAGVTGMPDPARGEEPVAFIVGENLDEKILRAHCAERMGAYKIPRRFFFVDSLPRDEQGRLDRPKLAALCREHLPS
ncbi:MAG TPA: AMP-binding protein [Candidatus Hydrogenedentes bacterium]|nr:AMP-binding protein [Candidatus Hydrogenedentota bacterium]HOV61531.1 AMP-binding protein [Candidatus Hydrogenedentota bacterium]